MKITLITMGMIIALAGLSFAMQGLGLINLKFWGVKYEDARRDVFEQSKSYNHGMIRDIENLCLQYAELESETHKQAIASTIRHRKSAFTGEFPVHVRKCLQNIK